MSELILPSRFLPAPEALSHSQSKSVNDLDSNDFLKLLLAELKNQDPLAPADSVQMLQQISQIRQITSNDAMVSTLHSVQAGQQVSTASQLIGKRITALSTEQQEVEGTVQRVTIDAATDQGSGRSVSLHVGSHQIRLDQVRGIVAADNG